MPETLYIRVDGVARMLAAWLRYREVFRADWWGASSFPNMRIFKPFLSPAYLVALSGRTTDGHLEGSMAALIAELGKGGQDDLDLFLHETWQHGVLDRDDSPALKGIASNDMVRRAMTTTPQERLDAAKAVKAKWDRVVLIQ